MSKVKPMTAEQLDKLVDESKEDVLQYFDLENARRGESRRINIDLPSDFLAGLDREAARRGITRQSLIKAIRPTAQFRNQHLRRVRVDTRAYQNGT